MDPRTFDGMIRQFARRLSRRSLVGGSLGAAVLAAVGLTDDTQAKKVKADRCLPPGRRCGTKKNDEPCRKCCQGHHIVTPSGKKKCACRPDGIDCSNASQCCAGACSNGRCGAPAVAPCLPTGTGCASPSQCCTGICEVGICRSAPCRAVNTNCAVNLDCCSGVCGPAEVGPGIFVSTCRNATCLPPDGEPCFTNADCCTEFCSTSFGDPSPGYCVPP